MPIRSGRQSQAGPGGAFVADFMGGGSYAKSKEEAAIKIQARMRGALGRKRVRVLKGGGGEGLRESMPMAQRVHGHPTDRELIGQKLARQRNEEAKKQGKGYAESSFDGQSTVIEKPDTPKTKEIRTPAPAGLGGITMSLNRYQDLQLAFEMCDSQREGALNRQQAHAFLRAFGWLVDDDELNVILDGAKGKPRDYNEVWGLKHLVEAMDTTSITKNGNREDLENALRLLAFGKQRISRNRLVEISVANSQFVNDNLKEIFVAALDRSTFRTMAVDDLTLGIMTKICNPPPVLEKYSLKHC